MNLEQLQDRSKQIESAIAQSLQSYQQLLGHKNEIDFQIEDLKRIASVETQVPVVDTNEIPVE